MPNVYYGISPSSGQSLVDISTALFNKYGSNVIMHYESGTDLIFSCNLISNKVIKIRVRNAYQPIAFYYGDSWVSGTTISNQILFAFSDSYSASAYPEQIDLILGDNFFMINIIDLNNNYSGVCVIGKLTNDNYIAVCCSNTGTSIGTNTTRGVNTTILTFEKAFVGVGGKLCKQNAMFVSSEIELEMNTDGSIATIIDLYNVSFTTGLNKMYKNTNEFLSSSGDMYICNGKRGLTTSLFVEF